MTNPLRPLLFTTATALALGALLLAPGPASAQEDQETATEETPTQLLVDLRDDTSDEDERQIESKIGGGVDLRLNSVQSREERFFIADLSPERIAGAIAAIKDDPRVEHVEPNFVFHALGVPNDPMWDKQWSMRMINAPAAWDLAQGKGVTVAVIDTGVAYEDQGSFRRVEDLAQTAFVPGYDFVGDKEHANDDHGHGTHVAGTIAQSTNNKIGVAGLAPGARIMPVKVLDRFGRGMAADIADAIRYAADEGAQVINMSLGGGGRSLVMESAVAYAHKKGVVVVCAAGNGGRGVVEYPAAYKDAFAVSSVGPDKQLAYYSSWGKELDIAAPGGDKNKGGDAGAILQNTITPQSVGQINQYLAFQGTSMATPHVAGAAALVISAGVTNPDEVEKILKQTAQPMGAHAWDEKYGAGLLDAAAAVKAAKNTSSGPSHLIVAALALLGLIAHGGRKLPLSRLGLGSLVGLVLGSSGLFFLDGLVGGVLGAFASGPIAEWDLLASCMSGHNALWVSVLPVFGLAVLTLRSKRLGGFLIGLAAGWAAYLLVSAVGMPADVRWMPGAAGLVDRIWLIANGGALLFLARLLITRLARRG